MKLDRNLNADGRGKYGLIKSRRIAEIRAWDGGDGEPLDQKAMEEALALLERAGVIDWADKHDSECFVIRLKDQYARSGLLGYADAAAADGELEYAREVVDLANRAGPSHPHCKRPD